LNKKPLTCTFKSIRHQ